MRFLTALISMLLLTMLLSPIMSFAAVQPLPIQLFLNGKQLSTEVAPRIVNNNTVVPIRIIAESLGSKVQWEEKSRKVTVDKEGTNIQLIIDKLDVIVNNKPYQLEAAPSIIDGNTMLPLRFVSEQLGVKVTWDDLTRSVFMLKEDSDIKVAVVNPKSTDDTKADISPNPGKVVVDKTADSTKDKPSVAPVVEPITQKPGEKTAAFPNQPAQISNLEVVDKVASAPTTISSIAVEADQFIIRTSGGKSLPNVDLTSDSSRIIIDIPNGQLDPALKLSANGEGSVKENSDSFKQIRYLLFSKESSIVRIIIDLTNKVDFKPSTSNSPNQLAWTIRPAKERFKVVIDPGHGGKDTGAISVVNRREKDFVLALGTKVYNLLAKEPKIEAYITRKDDTFVELPDRVTIANEMKADLFVSIHGNSASKEDIDGSETYYYTDQSLPFAKLMHQQLLKSTGFPDRKVKQSGFHVIKNTTMPSLLLEVGFLSNKTEENAMFQEGFQNQVAAGIVAGIKQQLKID
jgi:N-acetylmuramoyl-L-alanine amidase